jgi:hypothetical protein
MLGPGRPAPEAPSKDLLVAAWMALVGPVGSGDRAERLDLTVTPRTGKLDRVAPEPIGRSVMVCARSLRTQQCAKSRRRIN